MSEREFLRRWDGSFEVLVTLTLQHSEEWNAGSGTLHDATKSYPSIDDKLSVVNRQIGVSAISDESHAGHHAVYQENWYDALGRRVLVRAQKSSVCNSSTFGDLACGADGVGRRPGVARATRRWCERPDERPTGPGDFKW